MEMCLVMIMMLMLMLVMILTTLPARTDAQSLELEQPPSTPPACFVTLCRELAQSNIAGCSPNKLTGAKHKNVRQNKQHNTLVDRHTRYSVRDKRGGRAYLIFVTCITCQTCGEKFVMWRNFRFLCVINVEKSEISPYVE